MKKITRGFTLLDLIIASVLVGIIMIAGVSFLSFARQMHEEQEDAIKAAYYAASQIEDLKYLTMRFSAIFDEANSVLSAGTNKPPTTKITGILPAGYTLVYRVVNSYWENPDLVDYKEITVTCTYPKHGRSVSLTGYVYR